MYSWIGFRAVLLLNLLFRGIIGFAITPTEHFDVVVSGGGPSGMAAALHLARNGHKTLLLEKRNEYVRAQIIALRGRTASMLHSLNGSLPPEAFHVAGASDDKVETFGLEILRSAGFVCSLFKSPYTHLISLSELEKAIQYHIERVSAQNSELLESWVRAQITKLDRSSTNVTLEVAVVQGDQSVINRKVSTSYLVVAEGAKSSTLALMGFRPRITSDQVERALLFFDEPLGEHSTFEGGADGHSIYLSTPKKTYGMFSLPINVPPAIRSDYLQWRLERDEKDHLTPSGEMTIKIVNQVFPENDPFDQRIFVIGDASATVDPYTANGANKGIAHAFYAVQTIDDLKKAPAARIGDIIKQYRDFRDQLNQQAHTLYVQGIIPIDKIPKPYELLPNELTSFEEWRKAGTLHGR